jgi:hypothetical protein
MRLSISLTNTLQLAFDFTDIDAAERAFAALRSLPAPVYADELDTYAAQVMRAANDQGGRVALVA